MDGEEEIICVYPLGSTGLSSQLLFDIVSVWHRSGYRSAGCLELYHQRIRSVISARLKEIIEQIRVCVLIIYMYLFVLFKSLVGAFHCTVSEAVALDRKSERTTTKKSLDRTSTTLK